MKREPKSERGALLLAPLFSRSLTLVARSFLLNRTETLATQATGDWDFTFRPASQILPIDIGLDYNYHEKWPKNVSGNFQMFFLNISKKF